MKVTVRFFAAAREALGRSELEQELPHGTTTGELLKLLAEEFPALRPHLRAIKVAVNRQYTQTGAELHDGDEVACLPPVGGG